MSRVVFSFIFFLAAITHSNSQTGINQNDAKVISSISEYFKLDRENIHLDLNKNVFLTEETLWFKG